jgi:RNA polymerase sigma-70 factor (ECF subfamily)
MASDDEMLLIQRAQAGDLTAFNILVLRYQNAIYTVAYRLMGDSQSASDMAQEAFIAAYRKISTYQGGNFRAWLARIVTNRCYDELRSNKRRRTDYIEDLAPDSDDGAPLPSNTPTPEQTLQQRDLNRALQNCINNLKDEQRLVLVMSDVQGMAYQEIADSTDTNIGTVKSRLSRARLAMRHCLQGVQELLPMEFRLSK